MSLEHVVESQQFDRPLLERIFKLASDIRKNPTPYQQTGKILSTIFYEPSTRTRLSFETAMLKLGGNVIGTENAGDFSSVSKGETLEDTIRITSGYANIIALRHFEIGAAKKASKASDVPIINAGDGAGQHPTQALLDLYTIQDKFQKVDDLTISMVGDLKYGRTVRSLCYLLGRFKNVKIIFVAPKICQMNDDIKDYLDSVGIPWEEESNLNNAAQKSDVIYMTRIQRERFLDMKEYEEAAHLYKIDNSTLPFLKEKSIVMHPLPRLDEIAAEVDNDPRMVYFEQAKNGLWIRMALIVMLLSPEYQQG